MNVANVANLPNFTPYNNFKVNDKYNMFYDTQSINKISSTQYDIDFLLTKCEYNSNQNITQENDSIDRFFNQKTPYNLPSLIISDDIKRINQNSDIYQKYSDVIYDECGNRFNIKNMRDSAGLLQAGYSRNIDLDSHLKNINYYGDKCFYDNWKKSPNSEIPTCDGLKRNSQILVPDYTPVGKHYEDCNENCNTNTQNTQNPPNPTNTIKCKNGPPTDIGCETNIRNRYDFSHNKFKTESCIKSSDRVSFKHSPQPEIKNSDKFPNAKRDLELVNTINTGVEHEYYKFFEDTKCVVFPQQRLFNNITKAKCLPSHHFIGDIAPKYLK